METIRQIQQRLKNLPATKFIELYEKYFPKDNLKSVSSKQALIDLSEKIHEENIDNTISVQNAESDLLPKIEVISTMNTECISTLKKVKQFLYDNMDSLNARGLDLYAEVNNVIEKQK